MQPISQEKIQQLLEEKEALIREAEGLSNRIHGLDRAMEILGYSGEVDRRKEASPLGDARSPSQSKIGAIRRVLQESRDQGLSVSGVVKAAQAQGVTLKKSSVGSVLSRMKHKGEVTYIDGRYHLIGQR